MKKILVLVTAVVLAVTMMGCNYAGYDMMDTNYHFDRAIIRMPDGSVKEMEIQKWTDAEDGEQLTITSKDGKRYLVSSYNCVLIED